MGRGSYERVTPVRFQIQVWFYRRGRSVAVDWGAHTHLVPRNETTRFETEPMSNVSEFPACPDTSLGLDQHVTENAKRNDNGVLLKGFNQHVLGLIDM